MAVAAQSASSKASERRFYARSRAFGRFGMRIFEPEIMDEPHWHGHVELNFIRNARLHYLVDGEMITVEPDQLVMFWANIPHRLERITRTGQGSPELSNIYLPLDVFLMMPHVPELQMALLNSAMICCSPGICRHEEILRWYEDYRSGNSERLDIVKMEINALLRRVTAHGLSYLRRPVVNAPTEHSLASSHVRHVVAMVRHILENLGQPLHNEAVTAVTGLHPNYALAIFKKVMNVPLKQFILRMRLIKARGMLLESDTAISTVAVESGFGSISQFYAHFAAAYGTSPALLRERFLTA